MKLPFIIQASQLQVDKTIWTLIWKTNSSPFKFLLITTTRKEKIYYEFTKLKSDITEIKKTFTQIMDHKCNSLPENMDSPKAQDHDTRVLTNKKDTPLEGGHYMVIVGIRTLKHEISSPKFYELLIKTKIKGDTALDLDNF